MTDPVYILIRTSGRPRYFARMMETIKKQTYKNIVTIVHSDDPRDEYVTGDIIIKGTAYGPAFGNAPYNLYNNRLLKAIPDGPGWYHFIDDDDMYESDNVIEKFVNASKKDHINVARVIRWNETIWPKKWGEQKSYQTECFLLHTDHKAKAQWWAHLGGDHDYSRKLTKVLPINWIDNLIVCRAQEGKGHGKKLDEGGYHAQYNCHPDKKIPVIGILKCSSGSKEERIRSDELKWMRYETACRLEKSGHVKITHWRTFEDYTKKPVKNIFKI